MSFTKTVAPSTYIEDDDGKKYEVPTLGFKQLGEYCLWYQYKEYSDAKKIGVTDQGHLKEIYERCRLKPYSFDSLEILQSMVSIEGIRKLTYLAIRQNDKSFEESSLDTIINLVNCNDIVRTVMSQTGLTPVTKEDEEETLGE